MEFQVQKLQRIYVNTGDLEIEPESLALIFS